MLYWRGCRVYVRLRPERAIQLSGNQICMSSLVEGRLCQGECICMVTVYFDRNVFADICELRRGLTESDIDIIERAVESELIIIPASITLIEETIGVLGESDERYSEHIKSVFGLVNKEAMVKPPNELLKDDCFSYAQGKPYHRLTASPS